MIRTKEQLVEALRNGKRVHGQMGSRPSAPWKYEVDGVTVHGNAFWAAEKAGLLSCVVKHWNHSTYRAKTIRFPKQGEMLNKRVQCCLHYDDSKIVEGVVMRDDIEEPFRRIVHLDDGRVVIDTECQLRPVD